MTHHSDSAPEAPAPGADDSPPNNSLETLDSDGFESEVSPFDALAFDIAPDANAPALDTLDSDAPLSDAPFSDAPIVDTSAAEEPARAPYDGPLHQEPYVEPRGSRWPLLIFLLLLVSGGVGGWYYVQTKAAEREARRFAPIVIPERMAVVPTDWGAATLATRLKSSGKIRDEAAFIESAKAVNLNSIQPGGYLLPPIAGPRELARVFKAGPTHEKATFPEGFTGIQIAARLKKEGFGGADGVEKLVYPATGFSPYEGTLFPDTYFLPIKADGKTLIAAMRDKFAEVVKTLPQPLPKVDDKPLTTREVVTLASLVERETNSKAEMPQIAGVMLNRLNRPMRLQIDATVQYARILQDKEHKSQLFFKDLKIESPFNTYLNDGLPPTPICNPGKDALMAAARPAKTDALFYVYSPKLKHHIFASDFEGHKRNVSLARRERDAIENGR